jgi:transglutaminase-like putative cysteine protease
MKIKIALLFVLVFLATERINAQDVKFGKVSKEELEEKSYKEDPSANAVVLYKKRRTYYDYSSQMGWTLKTEVHERIKLYNKDGFENATKKIRIFTSGGKDESLDVKAFTYNLENGKVEKTKLGNDGSFNEEINENWLSKNFTMPNLKEGCIVEWRYEISSPYYSNIDDVICQYDIPIKYLEAKVQVPEFFEFKYLPSIYYPIDVKQSKTNKQYSTSSKYRSSPSLSSVGGSSTEYNNVSVTETVYETTAKNVPALADEPYVNSLQNYIGKIDFELAAYKPRNGIPEFFNQTWEDVTKSIYESSNFGGQLDKSNYFEDDLARITSGLTGQNDKMQAIFEFVKKKMNWNENYGKYTSDDGVKKAYKDGVGNVAEINLILVAMLRKAGIPANPILVSTRRHGIALFPTKEGFNYVIAGVENNADVTLLDATEKYSLPDVLPLRDLNWEGRLIREHGSSTTVKLYPNKYNTKIVSIQGKIDEVGSVSGIMRTNYYKLNALDYRKNYNNLSETDLISKLEVAHGNIEIEKIRIDNKDEIYEPIAELLKFSIENQADIISDKMYISPLLFLTVRENPFKQEERLYPIDYGSPWNNEIHILLELPEGYTVESKPENASYELPGSIGAFTLESELLGNKIKIDTNTKINTAILAPTQYADLKNLYKQAIEKQLEKIVLVQAKS